MRKLPACFFALTLVASPVGAEVPDHVDGYCVSHSGTAYTVTKKVHYIFFVSGNWRIFAGWPGTDGDYQSQLCECDPSAEGTPSSIAATYFYNDSDAETCGDFTSVTLDLDPTFVLPPYPSGCHGPDWAGLHGSELAFTPGAATPFEPGEGHLICAPPVGQTPVYTVEWSGLNYTVTCRLNGVGPGTIVETGVAVGIESGEDCEACGAPGPLGCCVYANGTATDLTEAECTATGGTWDPTPCTPPIPGNPPPQPNDPWPDRPDRPEPPDPGEPPAPPDDESGDPESPPPYDPEACPECPLLEVIIDQLNDVQHLLDVMRVQDHQRNWWLEMIWQESWQQTELALDTVWNLQAIVWLLQQQAANDAEEPEGPDLALDDFDPTEVTGATDGALAEHGFNALDLPDGSPATSSGFSIPLNFGDIMGQDVNFGTVEVDLSFYEPIRPLAHAVALLWASVWGASNIFAAFRRT